MKKIFLIAALVGISGLVHATTINAPSQLIGVNSLEGNNAYSWGIAIAAPSGQTVTSAEIDFTGVTLTASGNSAGTGELFTDLINSPLAGYHYYSDNDAPGDFFKTIIAAQDLTRIGDQVFASVGTTYATLSYVLTGDELAALNAFLAKDGAFNIGIDPDCHFTLGGLSFTYTLGTPVPKTVPDDALTALLVVIGLAGLEIFRRQLVPAKSRV
jgi:hypothetical protein